MSAADKLARAFPGKQWRIKNSGGTPTFADFEWLDPSPAPTEQQFNDAINAADPPPADPGDLDNIPRALKALALTFAQITSTAPATVKTIFKQKWDQLG